MNIALLITAAISLTIIILSIIKFLKKEKNLTVIKLAITLFIWSTVLLFAISPDVAHLVTEILGLGENLNSLIFLAFVANFLMLYKVANRTENFESDISRIVREEALRDIKTGKKKS